MTFRKAPLGGCDAYLIALEDLMIKAGQGRHVGVTVIQVESGFDLAALDKAASVFSKTQPLLGGLLSRGFPGSIPKWKIGETKPIRIDQHEEGADWRPIAQELLQGGWEGLLRFDVIPMREGGATVLMGWSHLVLDARGIELALAEIARLGESPDESPESNSWEMPPAGPDAFGDKIKAVRPFLDRYWSLRENSVLSLAPPPSNPSGMEFEILHFSPAETKRIKSRAKPVTAGIFNLPWFLAITMRTHAEVIRARSNSKGTLECTISVQTRKRGSRGPIFQNQVSQLFFALGLDELDSLESACKSLHTQFAEMTKNKFDTAFLVMIGWMRRLPESLYRRFLLREASCQIASFYHAHTGEFLPGIATFCGGRIVNGWHVPSVPQPPGTGLFFSERDGSLSASLCWRSGAISAAEKDAMVRRVRIDLLGSDD